MDELESSCDDRLQCGEGPCDYDGDGAADPSFYRPTTGFWFGVRANGQTVVLNANIGFVPGDIPVPADYKGDGKCDPGYVRPGVGPGGSNLWYSVPTGGGAVFQIYLGITGDIPVPADYDGDGKVDAAVFRPSNGLWIGARTGASQLVLQLFLGQNADVPIPGDYDGNGAADPAIYRPSSGMFFGTNAAGNTVLLNTNLGLAAGDIPTAQRPHYPNANPFFMTQAITTNSPSSTDGASTTKLAPASSAVMSASSPITPSLAAMVSATPSPRKPQSSVLHVLSRCAGWRCWGQSVRRDHQFDVERRRQLRCCVRSRLKHPDARQRRRNRLVSSAGRRRRRNSF